MMSVSEASFEKPWPISVLPYSWHEELAAVDWSVR